MDDIVERFLEKKLGDEIKEARRAADGAGLKTKCTKLMSILDDCQELLDLMRTKKGTGREKLYNLLNVITEWHDLSTKTTCPTAKWSLDNISNYLKQVKKDLEAEPTNKELAPPKEPQIYRWSCHAESLANTHGFVDKLMIMERLLLKPTPKPIGIVGVAGVGKTALCQQAYNHPPVKEHFLLRIWLCLSKNQAHPKMKLSRLRFEDQLRMMLSCLGYEDEVIQKIIGEEKLKLALQRHLSRGRYLIVLDDVWIEKEKDEVLVDEEFLKLLKFLTQPLGALIVTSRSPELEQVLGASNTHKLSPLADGDSCLNIFTDALEDKTKKLSKDEEKLIHEKCAGLPLMAKMLGKIGLPSPTQTPSTTKPEN